jgi:hypothetical protein
MFEEDTEKQTSWTVQDADGVTHRALQQSAGSYVWVITICPWWYTHNVHSALAPVRVDQTLTCLECTRLEITAIGKPKCKHCGLAQAMHNQYIHEFAASA